MPCWELFEAQPRGVPRRGAAARLRGAARRSRPASRSAGERWVGDRGDVVSIDRFGASAPGAIVLEKLGFTPDNVADARRARCSSAASASLEKGRRHGQVTAPPPLGARARASGSTTSRATCSRRRARAHDATTTPSSASTSNPTIFQKAISEGDAYDEQLREAARRDERPEGALHPRSRRPTSRDACDLLRPVWDDDRRPRRLRLDRGRPDARLRHARRRRRRRSGSTRYVDRPNLLVKIPATKPGLPAIEDMIAKGKSINVTLIFSLRALRGGRRGLHPRARAARRRTEATPRTVASVASFFVSRVDTEADRRLDELGGHDDLKGKLAIANAQARLPALRGARSPASAGSSWRRRARRLSAACGRRRRRRTRTTATSLYVEELIGPDTVDTMPEETIRGLPGSRQGRSDARAGGSTQAERVFERARGRRGRLRRRHRHARARGRREVRRRRSSSCSTASAPPAGRSSRRAVSAMTEVAENPLARRPDRAPRCREPCADDHLRGVRRPHPAQAAFPRSTALAVNRFLPRPIRRSSASRAREMSDDEFRATHARGGRGARPRRVPRRTSGSELAAGMRYVVHGVRGGGRRARGRSRRSTSSTRRAARRATASTTWPSRPRSCEATVEQIGHSTRATRLDSA